MLLNTDPNQPAQQTVGSMEHARLWPRALSAVDGRPLTVPWGRPYSFLAECECPFECLRDHENE